ncbi:MAG: ferric reductase-like transmembrane domain-containing protein [Sphingopyxis sp.]|nr:ferric reductase-like transmembrane domain-containing protein [Sphingopyxis sp.]
MMSPRALRDSLPLFWLLLAVPGAVMLYAWASGATDTMDMIAPTGEWAARLMIAAMLLGPLTGVLGSRGWLRWLLARRRALGVAAFGYAALHLAFYVIDMGSVAAMLDELPISSIWTGWLALAVMLPMALTSNMAAMRALKRAWKLVQRLAYPAAVLTLLHWLWVHDGATIALVHFAPLALVWLGLAARRLFSSPPLSQAGA